MARSDRYIPSKDCPYCPIGETGPYVEHEFRANKGSMTDIISYVNTLLFFKMAIKGMDKWTREALGRLLGITQEHQEIAEK